jgi:DNA recombination protein RmuC
MPIEIAHVWLLSGACGLFGLLAGWLAARILASFRIERMQAAHQGQLSAISEALRGRESLIDSLNRQLMDAARERDQAMGKLAMIEEARVNMADAYRALSAQALRENNQIFLDLAKTSFSKYVETARGDLDLRAQRVGEMIQPVTEALKRYDQQVQAMERSREKAYGGLSEQVQSLAQTQLALQKETGKLVKALRLPHVRGRWGEMTLKRVAELAGMQDRCDFFEQPATQTSDGLMRPDMVVMLPGGRKIVVDAKVPIAAYLDSLEADTDAERAGHLAAHVRQLQAHIASLSQKAYWRQFSPTPEFVVLFIPGENFFSAALHQNPRLIEEGIDRGIVMATPTTLITLLKTVAFAWSQEIRAENARTISELGRELYERIASMAGHLNKLGKDIERCSITYNQVIGTMERRVLASARKFSELGITGKVAPEQLRIEPGKTPPIQYPTAEEHREPGKH